MQLLAVPKDSLHTYIVNSAVFLVDLLSSTKGCKFVKLQQLVFRISLMQALHYCPLLLSLINTVQ